MHWSDLDVAAKVLETCDETPDLGGLGAAVEVIGAEVVIESYVFEYVVDGGEDGGGDRADRLLRTAAAFEAQVLRLQIAALLANGGPGALNQEGLEPGRALAQARGAALAGALVIARTQVRPGQQMAGSREAAHVGADVADDALGAEPNPTKLNPGNPAGSHVSRDWC